MRTVHCPIPLPSKDSYFEAFGPKVPSIYGCWAILMLRDRVSGLGFRVWGLGMGVKPQRPDLQRNTSRLQS